MGTGHVWTDIPIPATAWGQQAVPAVALQTQVGIDERIFIIWDPYVSTPVSTLWDNDTTTWIA